MCARTGVCAETHRRTHTHTHTTRASTLCAPGHSGWPSSWPSRTHSRLPATPAPAQDSPRGRLRRRAPGTSRPHGMRAWACAQVTRLSRTPPRPALLPQGRKMADRHTHHFELRDRPTQRPLLAVHKGICKTRREPKVRRMVGTTPRGHLPPRTLRTVRVRLRLPVCILSPKRKACAAQ